MDKEAFLHKLRNELRELDDDIIRETVQEYENFIQKAEQKGLAKEEMIQKLRKPHEIAADVKRQYGIETKTSNLGKQIIIGAALILFNLCIALAVVVAGYSIVISLLVVFFIFIFTPVLMVFQNSHPFEWSLSFILSGIGLILFPLMLRMLSYVVQLTKRYVHWNVRVWKESAYE